MTEQSFSLIPFPGPNIPDISIKGEISLEDNILNLQYLLDGKIEAIRLPPKSPNPSRKDELWKSTCFEFFLALRDLPEYWEFNMSPSGDWNVFHMGAYRRVGFREETSIQHLQLSAFHEENFFTLRATVDLKSISQEIRPLEVGITAVIQTNDGNETYWALIHPALHPDFHLRESFVLALAGQSYLSPQSVQPD